MDPTSAPARLAFVPAADEAGRRSPEPAEFHMDLTVTPPALKPGQPAELRFSIHDPWKDRPVKNFQIVHEKLFHMFVVSQDLKYFVHDHPVFQPDGDFTYNYAFPQPACTGCWVIFIPMAPRPNYSQRACWSPARLQRRLRSQRLRNQRRREHAGGTHHRSAGADRGQRR